MADVAKIAACEEGGTEQYRVDGPWFYSGSAYPDSVGIDAANWWGNGGTSCVTDVCQTQVELNFLARYGAAMPDQDGCGGSY